MPHRRSPRSWTVTPGSAASRSRSPAATAVTRVAMAGSPHDRAYATAARRPATAAGLRSQLSNRRASARTT